MKKRLLLVLILLSFVQLKAQYKLDTLSNYKVGPGMTYTKIRIASIPLNMDMLTVDLKNPYVKVESVKGKEKLIGSEVLSSMINRHTGPAHTVVAGVNSDFFNMGTGQQLNIQIENGEILQQPDGLSAIGFDVNNKPMLARVTLSGKLVVKDTAVTIAGVNQSRSTNQMILYNSYGGTTTGTNVYGTEALVHPVSQWLANDTVVCVVDTVVSGAGSMPVPTGMAVLSGNGTMSTLLNTKVAKGDIVKIYLGVTPGINKLKEMLGGYPKIVFNGQNWADEGYQEEGGPDHTYLLEPRTGVGFDKDSTKMFLFVADGRSPGVSDGVTLPQFADIMLQEGVYQGLNFDGGGSSEMMVRNSIMNVPSDGGERSIANALLVVSTAPVEEFSNLAISPSKKELFRGDKFQFIPITSDKYYNAVNVDISKITYSCDPKIGTIDSKGLFTAGPVNSGSGYVYVSSGSLKDSALVTFRPIVKIDITPGNFVTDTVKSVRFNLKAYDDQNTLRTTIPVKEIKWSYTDSTLGYVDANSYFHGKKEGHGKLIASYYGVLDTLNVTVAVGKDTHQISEMENLDDWTLTGSGVDMDNTKMSVVNDVKSSGAGALKVDYKFTYDGNTENKVILTPKTPLDVYGVPDTLLVDGRVDSTLNHRIYLYLSDDNNELFRANPANAMNMVGSFGSVRIPAKASVVLTTGGYFMFPIKITRIDVSLDSKKVVGQTYTGTFYLDNLRSRYPLQTSSVVEENNSQGARVEGYGLMQNYPNPFNPSTVIEFRTKEFSHVSLRVYDMLGREVSVLVDKDLPMGSHKVNFNAQNLASGVYFYRLQSGSMVDIKKMMLVR